MSKYVAGSLVPDSFLFVFRGMAGLGARKGLLSYYETDVMYIAAFSLYIILKVL